MARIRTIKPEFPQSESMGRVSREARLCFILLWTIADDAGRLRGNSRMLASLLYPYDEDARDLIDGWLDQLEHETCIKRYEIEGMHYLQVTKWQDHQKIDKPSKSKIPECRESSRTISNPRECSSEDQGGERKGPEDQGGERNAPEALPKAPPKSKTTPVPRSTGANGEFMLATHLLQELKLAATAGDISVVAQVITLEASEHGGEVEAAEFIKQRAIAAQIRGEPVTVFWLKDRKFAADPIRTCRGSRGALPSQPVSIAPADENETYRMWESMSDEFKRNNPWKRGEVMA